MHSNMDDTPDDGQGRMKGSEGLGEEAKSNVVRGGWEAMRELKQTREVKQRAKEFTIRT